jgi:rare lipoprotein A
LAPAAPTPAPAFPPAPPPFAAPAIPIPEPLPPQPYFTQIGMASFYGGKHQGRKTATGERFNKNDFTAAHLKLPFGTVVRVTNLRNGLTVRVRINDRGPHVKGRILDLSTASARALGFWDGVAKVRVEAFAMDQPRGGDFPD